MNFLEEATARGFVHTATAGLSDALEKSICGYVGFDCTADSLHVGNLTSLMLARLFIKHGHWPILVVGDATTRIGDPSGKDESRQILDGLTIEANATAINFFLRKFFDPKTFEGHDERIRPLCEIVPNSRWYDSEGLSGMRFMQIVGPHLSVNRMLTQDSIRNRLAREQSLSLMEFNYLAYQAYDFAHMGQIYDCVLQIGGSDQYGNIVAGIDLGKKLYGQTLYGLTTPLITTAAGEKMGKSAGNAVWLDPKKTSVFDYWQFWRNTDDKDVLRFLKMFTEIDLQVIGDYEAMLEGKNAHPNYPKLINQLKVALATFATTLVHGGEAANQAEKAAESVFGAGGSEGLPEFEVTLAPYGETRYADLFVTAGLAESIGAAKRLARGGGARVVRFEGDDFVLTEETMMMKFSPMFEKRERIKLSAGRKRHAIIVFKSFHVR